MKWLRLRLIWLGLRPIWLLPFVLLGLLWVSSAFAQRGYNADVGTDITIDDTAGGVTVLAADNARLTALLYNNGGFEVRCAPSTEAPTTTNGFPVPAGGTLVLGPQDGVQLLWACIRTTANSSTIAVFEGLK